MSYFMSISTYKCTATSIFLIIAAFMDAVIDAVIDALMPLNYGLLCQ
jgi:hypothetical protein